MLHDRPIQMLLAEDDPAHAEIVRRILADHHVPIVITHVEDGQAALDYLQDAIKLNTLPDLILLDLRMPKLSGLDVLKKIRSDPEIRRIPKIILTTSKYELDIQTAYENGAVSYLVKPVDFMKFTELLEAFGFFWLSWNQYPDKPGS